ncbi:MAG: oxygen-dependent coproporphyrinogen oxidase [Cytophagales bacterium]|nr:oxygen-dependent coproporphyrinogen oxidase [Cytophagales bacterium]
MITKEEIALNFRKLQDSICTSLEYEDGLSKFREDHWERHDGGGGITRIMEGGDLIEKGGVNFSEVFGKTPEKIMESLDYSANYFYATGISIVLHPKNPHVPIIHMNIRYFEMDDEVWWFGGGIDLTPHYIYPDDASFFHRTLKDVCDHHDPAFYPRFKTWADEYFFVKHRNETRGIGGIFFDRLNKHDGKDDLYKFVIDVGRVFIPIYVRISRIHKNKSFSERQRDWQLIRRSRYAEFNLVQDRGTKFGLESGGRIESIFMSLPPLASWKYDFNPEPDSPEYETLELLRKDIDWINERIHDRLD